MRFISSLLAVALCAHLSSRALAAPPTAEAASSVWSHYYQGQGQGPVFVSAKLCTAVSATGTTPYECTALVPATGVKAGTTIYVWQSYLVPKGDTVQDLQVAVMLGSTVRETKDVSGVTGTEVQTRVWTPVRLSRAGIWTLNLMRGTTLLASMPIIVY